MMAVVICGDLSARRPGSERTRIPVRLPAERHVDTCSVDGCNRPKRKRGYCVSHYDQLRRSGQISTHPPRSAQKYLKEVVLHYKGDGCLEWPFQCCRREGYGKIRFDGMKRNVHRIVCRLVHGDPTREDDEAAHLCGNARCVNPAHLVWASRKENEHHKLAHGTAAKGARHGRAKLTNGAIVDIRSGKEPAKVLAARYSVTLTTIYDIRRGKTWRSADV